jgi:hypothetical protein
LAIVADLRMGKRNCDPGLTRSTGNLKLFIGNRLVACQHPLINMEF